MILEFELRSIGNPDRDSAQSVHLPYNAGKQALARTCNLDYSEGLPINCVDRKAFFFARETPSARHLAQPEA
jgi:hypothetical protein